MEANVSQYQPGMEQNLNFPSVGLGHTVPRSFKQSVTANSTWTATHSPQGLNLGWGKDAGQFKSLVGINYHD